MLDLRDVAEDLVEELTPFCDRIEIAGSIRRGVNDPHDIELVMVPRFEQYQVAGQLSLDGSGANYVTRNLLDQELECWRAAGRLQDRKDKNNRGAWGDRYKRMSLIVAGQAAPLDLFSCIEPAQWGVLFALRTGPAEYSHVLVTSRIFRGVLPLQCRVKGGHLERGRAIVDTPEEEDFFREIEVPCWTPEKRSGGALLYWNRRREMTRTPVNA